MDVVIQKAENPSQQPTQVKKKRKVSGVSCTVYKPFEEQLASLNLPSTLNPLFDKLDPKPGFYKGNCKFLLRWFRGGFLGLLTIHIPILYLSSFSESNAWDSHLVMTEISGNVPSTSEDFRWITEDFRSLPKIKYPQMFQKTFEHFGSYLKDYLTILKTCFDMISLEHKLVSGWFAVIGVFRSSLFRLADDVPSGVRFVLRTICPDLWVRREKLSLMHEIDVFSPQA